MARDPLPATVLMVNAMNTSVELSELLRRGNSPFDFQSQSSSSGSIKIERRSRPDFKPDSVDLNVSSSNDSKSLRPPLRWP